MKSKKWKSEQKFQIVVNSLKSQEKVSDFCVRHGIAQSQYYAWREQFMKNGLKAFELDPDKKTAMLESRIQKLTHLVGQLTIDLKKTENELTWLES